HFTKLGVVEGYKQESAKCNRCSFTCASIVLRCEEHFRVCTNTSIEILKEYFGEEFEHPRFNGPRYTTTANQSITRFINKPNSNLNQFLDNMNTTDQANLQYCLTKAIFQCGLPLSFSENKPIIEFFKKLRSYLKEKNFQQIFLIEHIKKQKLR
ncbi:16332_t:CDS:1, partial [Racocetra fulgida]